MLGYEKEQRSLTKEQKQAIGLLSIGTFLEYFDFKVTRLTNGNTVMEYTMLSDTPGYTKKCINVIDNYGNKINPTLNELYEYKLTINPEGYTIDIKPYLEKK